MPERKQTLEQIEITLAALDTLDNPAHLTKALPWVGDVFQRNALGFVSTVILVRQQLNDHTNKLWQQLGGAKYQAEEGRE